MIAANELRVGNWVDTTGGYQWIEYIAGDATLSDGDVREYEDLYPIPLTPEILEKAGFVDRGHLHDHYLRFQRNDILIIAEWSTSVCGTNSSPVYFKHVLYVHQLQNLYFALTGQELTISL